VGETRDEFPELLALKAFARGGALGGAWFKVVAPTSKNAAGLLFGPADDHGELVVRRADLERQYRRCVSLGVMDFGPWTGELFVGAVTLADAANLRDGFDAWQVAPFGDGDDYLERVEALEAALQRVAGEELHVRIGSDGAAIARPMVRRA